MVRFNSIRHIKVTWVYEDQIYLYESVRGSIVAKAKPEFIRFELRDLYEEHDNFEVLIRKERNTYIFKTDYYGSFPLKVFAAQDEVIFYHEGTEERVYVHLS